MSSRIEQSSWRSSPEQLTLLRGVVHLWRIRLDVTGQVTQLQGVLSADELTRMNRYRYSRDRDRFAVCRGALRNVLERYLDKKAEEVEFLYGPHGKPFIAGNRGEFPLEFNISHSSNYALMGFMLDRAIGVDVELMRADLDIESVSLVSMSSMERNDILSRSGQDRVDTFYRYWTCKEAYLKMRGVGMTLDPRSFSMSLAGPQLVQAPVCDRNFEVWSSSWVDVEPDYRGAFVCEGNLPSSCEFYDFQL
jgi:4'-phosphopantetheinyl transferase